MREVILMTIGNTHTRLVRWREDRVAEADCLLTADLSGRHVGVRLLNVHATLSVFGASVVPAARQAFDVRYPGRIQWLTPGMVGSVDLTAVDSSTLGADRLANAAAAVAAGVLPALVVDCGTAVSSVLVDAEARLLGGFILPGRALWRQALVGGTAQLPGVDVVEARPPPFGPDTRTAIRAGIDGGILGAVNSLIAACREKVGGEKLQVWLTGGDREYFLPHLDGVTATEPDPFAFLGLARIACDQVGFSDGPA